MSYKLQTFMNIQIIKVNFSWLLELTPLDRSSYINYHIDLYILTQCLFIIITMFFLTLY